MNPNRHADNDMSYMETHCPDDPNAHECVNCHTSENLVEFWPEDEPKEVLMCQECADAAAALEDKAAALCAKPGCQDRQAIIDSSARTGQLVNRLTHHDQTCFFCRPSQRIEPAQARLFPKQEVA